MFSRLNRPMRFRAIHVRPEFENLFGRSWHRLADARPCSRRTAQRRVQHADLCVCGAAEQCRKRCYI